MKTVGLALGGGGARGLSHIPYVQALDELGVKPAIISGTSIGSIIGGFYAAGLSGKDMEALTEHISILEIGKMIDLNVLRSSGLVKGKGVTEFLEEHLPVHTFEQLNIPLKVVAADFWKGSEVVIDSGNLVDAIRASISIPGIFIPYTIDNILLVDGGVVNPLPMSVIREHCDILIAIDVSGIVVPPKNNRPPSVFDIVMNTYHIMEAKFLENDLAENRPEIYVKPPLENVQVLDFHRAKKIMKCAQKEADGFKQQVEDALELKINRKRSFFPFFRKRT